MNNNDGTLAANTDMNTIYRIQVNIKDGLPIQWRTLQTVYTILDSIKDERDRLANEWKDILEFRVIKIEVVE